MIRSELEALRHVANAARFMPRRTPDGSSGSTVHQFGIMAVDVWCLNNALIDLDEALGGKRRHRKKEVK